jgi:putative DNA methylase
MLEPNSWKDRPALIEYLFPVQKLSVESFKEQMAGSGKTLVSLGGYWKGRKPLILNKACILGSLLPFTGNLKRDLEIFEMLMGMDNESIEIRLIEKNAKQADFFKVHERSAQYQVKYKDFVRDACRPEECDRSLFDHIWNNVNEHLGTSAKTFSELVEQMGIARFGHRPRVADVFSGSGQIPFEAARLGCKVYASDLNPISCMLTWGAFNVVGANSQKSNLIKVEQNSLAQKICSTIDTMGIESDENGWNAKAFLYCSEVICPETGWKVPLLPSRVISCKSYKVIANLIPIHPKKRYEIDIAYVTTNEELDAAREGTVQDGYVVHSPDGINLIRTKISTIRGDFSEGKVSGNKLRFWEKTDFIPRKEDVFQERLYCVLWKRKKKSGKGEEYEFRSVTANDLQREQKVIDFVTEHFSDWQENGWIPDMKIEPGDKTDEPIRTRGWTYWHHLFNPRQLLSAGLVRQQINGVLAISLARLINQNSRLSRWDSASGGGGCVQAVFDNQALNTLYNYGCRASSNFEDLLTKSSKHFPIDEEMYTVNTHPAQELATENDIYITDPPYGDAVKYEEITEFFIAWLRKNPPAEFAHWTWDSRRSLAVKGEDEGFRQGMIAAYRKMGQMMPDNGIQVLMFTHQSGSIWADMANIVWAAGLQVTAAWYIVTETDSALRQGANVTGTIMLVLRKRIERKASFRDDLGWEIETAVKQQVESLIGLDKTVRADNSEGLYNDADIQMAGYAAALRVLTTYAVIDGKEMETEATAPRKKGVKNFVDELIDFAVQTAVQFLVPIGFEKEQWQRLAPIERYYLKMVDMEAQGEKTLDNYQNFAKAFRVHHFDTLMASSKANSARLLTSDEFKGDIMNGTAEIVNTPLRALLYAMYEVQKDIDTDDILLHLMTNCANYLQVKNLLVIVADFLASKRKGLKPVALYEKESSAARVLAEALRNQRI